MRAIIQRVSSASVLVEGLPVGTIERGLLVLLGVGSEDGPSECAWLAQKIATLRIFPDADGKMNLSAADLHLAVLVVSQFTVYANCRKGRRPHFGQAADPAIAEPLYESFCDILPNFGITSVERGRFGAMMEVSLTNDGPVTLILDTP